MLQNHISGSLIKRCTRKLFLGMFSIMGGFTAFLLPISLSHGNAQVTGSFTISTDDCLSESEYNDAYQRGHVTIPVQFRVVKTSENEYYGLAYLNLTPEGSGSASFVYAVDDQGYSSAYSEGLISVWYPSDTTREGYVTRNVKIFSSYVYNEEYCPDCPIATMSMKYKIFDPYSSVDEELQMSGRLERDITFISAYPEGDRVRYKFSGKAGDKIKVEASITDYGSIPAENWYRPRICLAQLLSEDFSDQFSMGCNSYGPVSATLSADGDYIITVLAPSYNGYNNSSCRPASGTVPVHITITSGSDGIVVNTAGDESDADSNDGVCDVDLGEEGEQCTLRAAIEEVNRGTASKITFDIPDTAKISPKKKLPAIEAAVEIDATTQSGGTVELNGENARGKANGLNVEAEGCTVKGMSIKGFSGYGIKAEANLNLYNVKVNGNKKFGVYSFDDITIEGEDNEFSENGYSGIETSGDIDAGYAVVQANNNGSSGILTKGGSVKINFTADAIWKDKVSQISNNKKDGIRADADGSGSGGNVTAGLIEVEGNGGKSTTKKGYYGIRAQSYVRLYNAKVSGNKGFGVYSFDDITIEGEDNEFSENGYSGIETSGDIDAGYAVVQANNNGSSGILTKGGSVKINVLETGGAHAEKTSQISENARGGVRAKANKIGDGGSVEGSNLEVTDNKGVGVEADSNVTIHGGKICDNDDGNIQAGGEVDLSSDVELCDD